MAKDDAPQTVTQFAVEQGTLDADAPGVQDAIQAEKDRAEKGTQRAQELSAVLNATQEDPEA